MRYCPKNTGLDALACIFEAATNVGYGLPIDIILDDFEVRWNMVRRYADHFEQSLQRHSAHSIVGQRFLWNSLQSLVNGFNR